MGFLTLASRRGGKLMKNLLLCQLELVHYQLGRKKAQSPRSRALMTMGMMESAAVVPEGLMLLKYVSSKYCMRRLVERRRQARPERCRSSQASYDELGLDSSAAGMSMLDVAL
jgi:hypothetical protein